MHYLVSGKEKRCYAFTEIAFILASQPTGIYFLTELNGGKFDCVNIPFQNIFLLVIIKEKPLIH